MMNGGYKVPDPSSAYSNQILVSHSVAGMLFSRDALPSKLAFLGDRRKFWTVYAILLMRVLASRQFFHLSVVCKTCSTLQDS
jgi:hypothetical protein